MGHGVEHPVVGGTDVEFAREIATEQSHVDRVYHELAAATRRAELVAADGLARGRTDRTGDVRDEEITGLFERDALVFTAARRRASLEREHEGLVFGRLDMEHEPTPRHPQTREIRYVGRLGVRDDDYEPLVVDWRAPAAAPFYRATPVQPLGVLRRRVLRCKGSVVVGAEDDLMVPEAPEGMVVLGEGALLAALSRSKTGTMRDIVATIQAHQDEAIRADARGVVEITGGPGTGKTVVALHRAAYLLYSDRRRFERGGVLVVGPSAAYTAYIERVLPSLGEDSVVLRTVGDIVDAMTATRVDTPDVAALKGALGMRRVLARAARDTIPGTSDSLRVMVQGYAVHLDRRILDRLRARVLRGHHRNASREAMLTALTGAAVEQWAHAQRETPAEAVRAEFAQVFEDHPEVERFLDTWWAPLDPREVLLWLAEPGRAGRYAAGVFSGEEAQQLAASYRVALDTGEWSVADVALADDLYARLGPIPEKAQERGFYEVELLDDAEAEAAAQGLLRSSGARDEGYGDGQRLGYRARSPRTVPTDAQGRRERLFAGRFDRVGEYAHILVDEAQDLSPMQWRMLGRRGRAASWTVVGDAAQASWGDPAEARAAREEAFGRRPRSSFHMGTNYRNAREIFDYAARMIVAYVPDADIPDAVRETGVEPVEIRAEASEPAVAQAARDAVAALAEAVDGAIAVIVPARWESCVAGLAGAHGGRVGVLDPLSVKGLEYDGVLVVDPDDIRRTAPGGARVLYVALTRAAHRMTVLQVS